MLFLALNNRCYIEIFPIVWNNIHICIILSIDYTRLHGAFVKILIPSLFSKICCSNLSIACNRREASSTYRRLIYLSFSMKERKFMKGTNYQDLDMHDYRLQSESQQSPFHMWLLRSILWQPYFVPQSQLSV